jgi:hypothetical protein
VSASLHQASHLPRRLRQALVLACDGARTIRTVEKLASSVGCDRRTLWTYWKQSAGRNGELRLQDFLHWVLLLRAAQRKAHLRSWGEAAEEIGIHPHTLGRLVRQLTGRSLRSLSGQAHATLLRTFETRVLVQVLTPPSDGPAPEETAAAAPFDDADAPAVPTSPARPPRESSWSRQAGLAHPPTLPAEPLVRPPLPNAAARIRVDWLY